MIAYKEALDHQMDVLESEIIQTDHQDIKKTCSNGTVLHSKNKTATPTD